jgi:hypothetical protein
MLEMLEQEGTAETYSFSRMGNWSRVVELFVAKRSKVAMTLCSQLPQCFHRSQSFCKVDV